VVKFTHVSTFSCGTKRVGLEDQSNITDEKEMVATRMFQGRVEVMEAKSLKQKIACDKNSQGRHIIVDEPLTVLTTKSGGASNQNAILFLRYSFIVRYYNKSCQDYCKHTLQ